METTTTTKTTTAAPAITPTTAELLAALRSFEAAVDHYYSAVILLRNPEGTDWPEKGLNPEEENAFAAARAIIEKKIQERVTLWANTTAPAPAL